MEKSSGPSEIARETSVSSPILFVYIRIKQRLNDSTMSMMSSGAKVADPKVLSLPAMINYIYQAYFHTQFAIHQALLFGFL